MGGKKAVDVSQLSNIRYELGFGVYSLKLVENLIDEI